MPRKFIKYLEPYNLFTCAKCGAHIATLNDLVSKTHHPADNTAYYFNHTVNLRHGVLQTKKLLSGTTQIVDLYCNVCQKVGEPVGWKYVRVSDPKMRYKQGLCILQKRNVKKSQWVS